MSIKWEWSIKLGHILVLIALVVFGSLGYWLYTSLNSKIEAAHLESKKISDYLIRAESDIVTKKQLDELANNLGIDIKKVREDLASLDAKMIAVGRVVANIKPQDWHPKPSTTVAVPTAVPTQPEACNPLTGAIPDRYCGVDVLTDLEFGGLKYGQLKFNSSMEPPWQEKTDEVDIEVKTIVGSQKKTGLLTFHHEIDLVNKTNPARVKLKDLTSEYDNTPIGTETKRWYWWAPHLNLTVEPILTFDKSSVDLTGGASLGITAFAYGKTEDDNDFRVLGLGVGLNLEKQVFANLTTLAYNIGSLAGIPLISDTWIGLDLVYTFGANKFGVALTIGTTL